MTTRREFANGMALAAAATILGLSAKPASKRLQASGCSSGNAWPAAATVSNRAPRMAWATAALPAGVAMRSSAPVITKVGAVIARQAGSLS